MRDNRRRCTQEKGGTTMNMYYHSFIMGFNWWYIVLPIMYFAIGYVGYKIGAKLTVNKHLEGVVNITVRSISADRAWATLAATLVTALVVKESSRGLIQLFDNSLSSGESGVWSIIAAGATIGFLWLVLMMAYQSAFARGKACKVNDYRHQLARLVSLTKYKSVRIFLQECRTFFTRFASNTATKKPNKGQRRMHEHRT